MHATVYSESFIKNGHISNRASLQDFEKIIKSDGKIAPSHLPGKVCLYPCYTPAGYYVI